MIGFSQSQKISLAQEKKSEVKPKFKSNVVSREEFLKNRKKNKSPENKINIQKTKKYLEI